MVHHQDCPVSTRSHTQTLWDSNWRSSWKEETACSGSQQAEENEDACPGLVLAAATGDTVGLPLNVKQRLHRASCRTLLHSRVSAARARNHTTPDSSGRLVKKESYPPGMVGAALGARRRCCRYAQAWQLEILGGTYNNWRSDTFGTKYEAQRTRKEKLQRVYTSAAHVLQVRAGSASRSLASQTPILEKSRENVLKR